MQKYEIDMEKLNYDYNQIAGKPAPSAIVDIALLFNKMINAAYQKGLEKADLKPSDYLFPVKEVKSQ